MMPMVILGTDFSIPLSHSWWVLRVLQQSSYIVLYYVVKQQNCIKIDNFWQISTQIIIVKYDIFHLSMFSDKNW